MTALGAPAVAFLVLCVATAPVARGQNEPFSRILDKPFSRIEIAGGGALNVGNGPIHDYWEPGYGGEISFLTPFYLGSAEAGAAYHRYEEVSGRVPRFDALLVFAGWGLALEPVDWVSWYNGFRLGNNRMTFDEETFPGVKNESEFLVGAQSRVTIRLFKQTGIFGAAHYTQTYTFVRFRTLYVSAGLTTSFGTPSWFQAFLR